MIQRIAGWGTTNKQPHHSAKTKQNKCLLQGFHAGNLDRIIFLVFSHPLFITKNKMNVTLYDLRAHPPLVLLSVPLLPEETGGIVDQLIFLYFMDALSN